MKAIAGSDVTVGMTIVLQPGGEPFRIRRIEPFDTSPDSWAFIYGASAKPETLRMNRWYALVES